MTLAVPRTRFTRPPGSDATEPPEARGTARDHVKLLVARPHSVSHTHFDRLGEYLRPGDLLVVNNSATLPAAVDAQRDGRPVTVHFSTARSDRDWVVELRPDPNAIAQPTDVRPGEQIALPGGGLLVVTASYPEPDVAGSRLWSCRLAIEGDVFAYLSRHGRPIRYSYVPGRWPLTSYQTVFSRQPGSAEMASAARPFTNELATSLVAAGVVIAPITLHAGVSSAEPGEPPAAEKYVVPQSTARLVNMTRAAPGRVIAVGTTVTRALESAADAGGHVTAAHGWTDLVLGPQRPARVVDGLITGWHDADASHLLLLEAVAGPDLVTAAYREAVVGGYLWHEFGDSALLLPAAHIDRPHALSPPPERAHNRVETKKERAMKAKVGDWLLVRGTTVEQPDQRGEIVEVRSADGSPPYVVRWVSTDHEATVYPGPDATVVSRSSEQ